MMRASATPFSRAEARTGKREGVAQESCWNRQQAKRAGKNQSFFVYGHQYSAKYVEFHR
jgi:hypothetical protein